MSELLFDLFDAVCHSFDCHKLLCTVVVSHYEGGREVNGYTKKTFRGLTLDFLRILRVSDDADMIRSAMMANFFGRVSVSQRSIHVCGRQESLPPLVTAGVELRVLVVAQSRFISSSFHFSIFDKSNTA